MHFGAHICVEFVDEHDVCYYLFKYQYKEDPKVKTALYRVDPDNPGVVNYDEFARHQELTYMDSHEAMDLTYIDHGSSHPVIMLPIHLPGMEPVYFQSGFETEAGAPKTPPVI